MRFGQIRGNLTDATFNQLQATIRNSIEKYDFDSGWIRTPVDKIVEHGLNLVPKNITILSATEPETEVYPDTWASVSRKTITINGPREYCRVLIDV